MSIRNRTKLTKAQQELYELFEEERERRERIKFLRELRNEISCNKRRVISYSKQFNEPETAEKVKDINASSWDEYTLYQYKHRLSHLISIYEARMSINRVFDNVRERLEAKEVENEN